MQKPSGLAAGVVDDLVGVLSCDKALPVTQALPTCYAPRKVVFHSESSICCFPFERESRTVVSKLIKSTRV